jgi:hypothetical protein
MLPLSEAKAVMTCLDRISVLRALEQKWLKNDTPLKLRPSNRATADSWISKLQFTTVLGAGFHQEKEDRIQKFRRQNSEAEPRTPNPKLEGRSLHRRRERVSIYGEVVSSRRPTLTVRSEIGPYRRPITALSRITKE